MAGRGSVRLCVLAIACLVLLGCARAELLQGLDERQANEVVATLLRHNISAVKQHAGKTGFAVEVAQQDLAEAIDLVQLNGLPSAPRTQIAAQFPADAMVSTPLGERARLLSAIEQRLEESLAALDGVQSARVHVNYDADVNDGGLQSRKPTPMHIAALLVHREGADEQVLLQSVKRFLRNAFADVAYDNVSVVLTPAPSARVLSVTPAQDDGWLWLLLPLALLLVIGTVLWLVQYSGRQGLAAMRRRFRRRRPLHAPSG